MTRSLRTSGTSRTLLRTATTTAALSALTLLACGFAPTAGADDTVQTVNPSGLGPAGPWFRLQETTPDRDPGLHEVSPKPDPVHLNGSLHLAIGAAQQAQAAHYFNATWTPVPMRPLLDAGISYWAYTSTEGSTTTTIGANLQLPASCGGFTTLSFEPGANTDVKGEALKPDTWQEYRFTADSVMRTSNAAAGIPAGGSAPLSVFVEKCEGAYGVIANIGRLGDANGTLNTYVDNITAQGTTWDFAVTGRATAALTVPEEIQAGDGPRPADASYTDPADGPQYPGIGTHLTLKGPAGLRTDQLTVVSEGSEVPLTRETDGTFTGELRTNLRAGGTLEPGGRAGAAFTLAAADDAPTGPLDVTAELTVTIAGADGPRRTGVSATDHTRITAADVEPSPSPSPTHPHHPKPTPPGGGHGGGHWGGDNGGHGGSGHGNGPMPNGPVDAGDGSTALTGTGSAGPIGTGLMAGAAGLLAVAAAALGGLRTVRRRRG
ncbi:hypothetical protein [Streptomyces sp. NBC_00338]|uniref:hypothetical protein n=1 Tax=Streptomyces sp. NBC_00338 TaxID=2975715 RepID=UPI0022568999|nr:hypothetical protein [Streptomyces sp. NBC_00338]MCX5142184.1 hypothetical protein [Streptomyces sp. NBC_00338]